MKNKDNQSSIEINICKNVKFYRKQLEKTQKDVAQHLNISLSSYQKLEQGQRQFSTGQLYEISKWFDVDIALLYDREMLDKSTIYGTMPSSIVKENLRKLLVYFEIYDFSIKDVAALIGYIKKYGKGFLYTPECVAIYHMDRYELENTLKSWLQSLEKYYLENMPGVKKEISDLVHKKDELLLELSNCKKTKLFLSSEISRYEEMIAESKMRYEKFETEQLQVQTEIATKLREELKEKYAYLQKAVEIEENHLNSIKTEYAQLKKQVLASRLIEQYFFNPHTLSDEQLALLNESINDMVKDEIQNIIDENDDLQYSLSLFEESGFDIEDVSPDKIEEAIQKKVNEYIAKKYHDMTPARVSFVIKLLREYVKSYGILKSYKDTYKEKGFRLTSETEIMNYYLSWAGSITYGE